MTVPMPPTDGPVPLGDRLDPSLQGGIAGPIEAPHPDLSAAADAAMSAGDAWCAEAGPLMGSAQGYGDGRNVTSANAAPEWPTDMSFPHQGP